MRSLLRSVAANRSRAAGVAITILSLCALPGCTLDRSFVLSYAVWDAVAVVRNAEGSEVAVTAAGDGLFAGESFVLTVNEAFENQEESARSRFKRAIHRRLLAGGDALFQARFGPGPWCLAAEPTLVTTLSRTTPLPVPETGVELPACAGPPPPPQCASAGDAALGVEPPALAFGGIPLGAPAPATIAVTLFNQGTGSLCLASVVPSGRDALDFSVDDTDCRPGPGQARTILGTGAGTRPSCTVVVAFSPTAPGPREGSLRVSSSDPLVLREFPLGGSGLAGVLGPTAPVCVPKAADGCFRRTLTLTNDGPGAVTVRSLYGSGVLWIDECSPSAPAVVPAAGTITCSLVSCSSDPGTEALIIGSDGVRDDPAATVVSIPIVPQTDATVCTP